GPGGERARPARRGRAGHRRRLALAAGRCLYRPSRLRHVPCGRAGGRGPGAHRGRPDPAAGVLVGLRAALRAPARRPRRCGGRARGRLPRHHRRAGPGPARHPAGRPLGFRRRPGEDPSVSRTTTESSENDTVTTYAYEKDGAAIYRESFATIRAEADLAALPADVSRVAVRMIHACGMVDLVRDLSFSPQVV